MTVTVPTWTVVLPLLLVWLAGVILVARWVDRRFLTPWLNRRLANRLGISPEDLRAARDLIARIRRTRTGGAA